MEKYEWCVSTLISSTMIHFAYDSTWLWWYISCVWYVCGILWFIGDIYFCMWQVLFCFDSYYWWYVFCWQSVILMCCMLGVFCLAWRLLVKLSVVWGFSYLETQWRLFHLYVVVERVPLHLCETVVEDWSGCCMLSSVRSRGVRKDVSPCYGSLWVECLVCDASTFLLISFWGIRETIWLQ